MKKSDPACSDGHSPQNRGDSAQAADTLRTAYRPFTADELRRIGNEISNNWAPSPTHSQLTLLDVDPWCVHAYWQLDPADLATAHAALGGGESVTVLRFTDISPGDGTTAVASGHFDVPVELDGGSCYVDLSQDARRYAAELGLLSGSRFVGLVRSNEVETSRGTPSALRDFRQADVPLPEQVPLAPANKPIPVGDRVPNDLPRDLYPVREPLPKDFPLSMAGQTDILAGEPPFPELPATDSDGAPFAVSWSVRMDDLEMPFPAISAHEIAGYRDRAQAHACQYLDGLPSELPAPLPEHLAPAGEGLTPLTLPAAQRAGVMNALKSHRLRATVGTAQAGSRQPVSLEALLSQPGSSFTRNGTETRASAEIVIHVEGAPNTLFTLFGAPLGSSGDGSVRLSLPLEGGAELLALLQKLGRPRGD